MLPKIAKLARYLVQLNQFNWVSSDAIFLCSRRPLANGWCSSQCSTIPPFNQEVFAGENSIGIWQTLKYLPWLVYWDSLRYNFYRASLQQCELLPTGSAAETAIDMNQNQWQYNWRRIRTPETGPKTFFLHLGTWRKPVTNQHCNNTWSIHEWTKGLGLHPKQSAASYTQLLGGTAKQADRQRLIIC